MTTSTLARDRLRAVLGSYPTGVSIVTAMDDHGCPLGLAVGTFTSVSLDPPRVGFLPANCSKSWPLIKATGYFCINVLSEHQVDTCRRFAMSGGDKFAGLQWRPAETGSPILDGAVTWIDCRLEAVHEAGDHDIAIGRVLDFEGCHDISALLFHRGAYGPAQVCGS